LFGQINSNFVLCFSATRCPRCKVEQNYLNVLVAHVLRDQCQDANQTEPIFVPQHSPIKKRPKIEETKSPNPISFSSNDVSSYKMSVLDGTQALEFTSLDNDGRQRKAHLCLFCGKVKVSFDLLVVEEFHLGLQSKIWLKNPPSYAYGLQTIAMPSLLSTVQ